MLVKNDKLFLIALNHFPKFGQNRLKKIKRFFPTWKDAFQASFRDLQKAGLPETIVKEFIAVRPSIIPEQLAEKMYKEKIGIIELADNDYSRLLSEIYDPPALLFYKGNIKLLNTTSLAIVGSRKNTSYGEQVCQQICPDLVLNNFSIVSGLALGIDSLAHNITLENHGNTIAVLGSGLDKNSIYPSANRYLANKIIEQNGLVISEFTLGTSPLRYNFPMRNRIISGLSLGVVVIESAIKSGALITAQTALEQNREIFSVPGNIFQPLSIGPNSLIKQGAISIASAKDIMDSLDLKRLNSYIKNKKIKTNSLDEKKIVSLLSHEPIHIDELARLSKINTAVLSSTLTLLELRGIIKNFNGAKYALLQ